MVGSELVEWRSEGRHARGQKNGMPLAEREGNEPGGAEVAVFTLPTFTPTGTMIAASPWCSNTNDGLPSALG